jgi:hypothetical protein
MAETPRSFSPTQVDANPDGDPALDPTQAALDFGADDLEAEGTHQGLGHRADKAPSDREHGRKTREHYKDIVSRRA